jgi:ABC-2 type transport system ATP-binding protein
MRERIMVEYAIETIDLVKRYPQSVRRSARAKKGVLDIKSILDVIVKKKGSLTALDHTTVRVKQGEVFGLLGPNGAGKTTLIKILCTLILRDEGEAYVNGFDVTREPQQVLRNLQAVISGGFDWRLTVRENLEFYAALYGLSGYDAQKQIDVLLNFVGLRDRANDMYQMLSTGMKRRLVLCKALLQDVPILLFDEPTSGLDPLSAMETRKLLYQKLSRDEGKTVFLSTHNLWEAQEICDRIAILDHGKIIACDSPDNIRRLINPEKIYDITLLNPRHNKQYEKVMKLVEELDGVNNLVSRVNTDRTIEKLTLHLEEKTSFSRVLEVILDHGLEIVSIDARDVPLEDAFISLISGEPKK